MNSTDFKRSHILPETGFEPMNQLYWVPAAVARLQKGVPIVSTIRSRPIAEMLQGTISQQV